MADIDHLPPELLLLVIKVAFLFDDLLLTFNWQVFYMLNWTDLGAAMAVCKRWAEVNLDLKLASSPGHHLHLHHPQHHVPFIEESRTAL